MSRERARLIKYRAPLRFHRWFGFIVTIAAILMSWTGPGTSMVSDWQSQDGKGFAVYTAEYGWPLTLATRVSTTKSPNAFAPKGAQGTVQVAWSSSSDGANVGWYVNAINLIVIVAAAVAFGLASARIALRLAS